MSFGQSTLLSMVLVISNASWAQCIPYLIQEAVQLLIIKYETAMYHAISGLLSLPLQVDLIRCNSGIQCQIVQSHCLGGLANCIPE